MRRFWITAGVIVLCGCTPAASTVQLQSPEGKMLTVTVEIADEPAERERGLMHRTELPEDMGMLFIFEREQPLAFWMKNTLIPLDILYFDAGGQWVSSVTMEPCIKDPCRTYPAEGPAQYALEVNKGYVLAHGIGEGWTLNLPCTFSNSERCVR